MVEVDFRLSGIDREDLENVLSEIGLPDTAYTIDEPKFASGAEFLELLVQLSNTEISLLDLFIGYCLGKGIPISQVVSGIERPISTLKDAANISKKSGSDEKKASKRSKK